jgi:mono/diheme cytochrome c family protein/glucose/arabinose dehydrogenase
MKTFTYTLAILIIFGLFTWFVGSGCKNSSQPALMFDSISLRNSIPPSPMLSPQESMKKIKMEEGFALQLVAAEPLITAPVAISFDTSGRIWVVQMNDYMPDTAGTGEEKPTGKIVILSDKNGDGVMDDRQVFIDSLVLPRAICLIDDGILVAEPPKLWYYKLKDNKPVHKTLVDATYAEGGNVEHQPNGLLRGLDNWIYNAKSAKRYRKQGDKWLIEKTHFRGQWGITQDNEGRLLYNNNSENLLGDYFSPGLGAYNANQQKLKGFNEKIVPDNHVYPLRPTTGVNRGYMKGVLNDSLRLVNFTAACGPVFYNGGLFGKEYEGNVFVAEPAGNLIKRNILQNKGSKVEGTQAYKDKEFIASEDERFRPVNLSVGPDGALYIVDMYRGIIQHKTYLTPYLKSEIKARALTEPLSCGRIYKVVPKGQSINRFTFPNVVDKITALLNHPNGWVRLKAQQLLVDGNHENAEKILRDNLTAASDSLSIIHSLWTLEGLHLLNEKDVLPLLKHSSWSVRMQAFAVLPSILTRNNYKQFVSPLQQMIARGDTLAAPYVGYLVHTIATFDKVVANNLLNALASQFPSNVYVADAIISNLQNREAGFYKERLRVNADTSLALNKRLIKVLGDIEKEKGKGNEAALKKMYPKGAAIFQSVCQTCHGPKGNGIASLAPPLNKSEWVIGDKNRFISIVLYGLTGPVKIGDHLYEAPEISGEMPGVGANKEFTDDDIAQVLNYVRNAWSNKGSKINAADVNYIRNKYKGREKAFTMDELNGLK